MIVSIESTGEDAGSASDGALDGVSADPELTALARNAPWP
jgi:hypothetical protein